MRERLERAIKQGLVLSAALGGCSSEQTGEPASGGAGSTSGGHAGKGTSVLPGDAGKAAGGDDATDGGAAVGGAAQGGQGGELEPYPQQAYPVCSGENYGGESNPFGGQCCVTAQCFTPKSGDCPAADKVGYEELPSYPPGSGECGCTPESGKFVEGPFAARADDKPETPGRCCYLVAAIGCTGRPLLIAGAPRVAAATRRSDWASRPRWAA